MLQAGWRELGLPAGSRVFVPLSGKSRDMLWLRDADFEVLGVELSPIAVRDFFLENGLSAQVDPLDAFERWRGGGVTLLQGDFFKLTPEHLSGVVGIYDRAALVAWPPEMRGDYLRHLAGIAPTDARILLVTMEYPADEMEGPPFSVPETEVRAFFEPLMRVELLHDEDTLAANPRMKNRGLSSLREKLFRITPRTAREA